MPIESKTMRELHKIREEIYEETKHMTPEERANFINSRAEAELAKRGLKLHPHPEKVPVTT